MQDTYDEVSPEDRKLIDQMDAEYVPGVVVVKSAEGQGTEALSLGRRVNVYVDGLLTTMPEGVLNHLIDIGFFIVVARRP